MQDSSGTAAADRQRMVDISRRIGLSELTGNSEGVHDKQGNRADEKHSQEHIE